MDKRKTRKTQNRKKNPTQRKRHDGPLQHANRRNTNHNRHKHTTPHSRNQIRTQRRPTHTNQRQPRRLDDKPSITTIPRTPTKPKPRQKPLHNRKKRTRKTNTILNKEGMVNMILEIYDELGQLIMRLEKKQATIKIREKAS